MGKLIWVVLLAMTIWAMIVGWTILETTGL